MSLTVRKRYFSPENGFSRAKYEKVVSGSKGQSGLGFLGPLAGVVKKAGEELHPEICGGTEGSC